MSVAHYSFTVTKLQQRKKDGKLHTVYSFDGARLPQLIDRLAFLEQHRQTLQSLPVGKAMSFEYATHTQPHL